MLDVQQLIARQSNEQFAWHFQLAAGQFMAVSGASGIGKSSLLNCLLGFIQPSAGRIYWCNEELTSRPVQQRPFSILFQQNNLFEHLTVAKNLALGLSPSGRLTDSQQQQVLRFAQRFQLTDQLNRKAVQLSGGQQQRVALARVFLQNKPVLLLDEPFSALDPAFREQGLTWVRELQKQQGTTIIMVTHHLNEVIDAADCVLEGISSQHWNQYPAR